MDRERPEGLPGSPRLTALKYLSKISKYLVDGLFSIFTALGL